MLRNLKKLNGHIKKGNLKKAGLIMLVQLLIDSLVELLQVVLVQLAAEESKQQTEFQTVFLGGIRTNVIAFQNLKKMLENLSDSDVFGELCAQPKSGELFDTKPKALEKSAFVQQLIKEQRAQKASLLEESSSRDSGLGL